MNPYAETELKTPKLDWNIEVQNIAIELRVASSAPPTEEFTGSSVTESKLNFTPFQEAFLTRRISHRLLPIRADSICSHLSACTMSYYSIFISQKLV